VFDFRQGQNFVLFSTAYIYISSGVHPATYLTGSGGAFYAAVKRPGREINHSPPSGAEVYVNGDTPPLSHMPSWHDAWLIKYRDSVYILFII
jgi:hypothetical protein